MEKDKRSTAQKLHDKILVYVEFKMYVEAIALLKELIYIENQLL